MGGHSIRTPSGWVQGNYCEVYCCRIEEERNSILRQAGYLCIIYPIGGGSVNVVCAIEVVKDLDRIVNDHLPLSCPFSVYTIDRLVSSGIPPS